MFSKFAMNAALMRSSSERAKFKCFEQSVWNTHGPRFAKANEPGTAEVEATVARHQEANSSPKLDDVRAQDIVEPVWFSDSFAEALTSSEALDRMGWPDGTEIVANERDARTKGRR